MLQLKSLNVRGSRRRRLRGNDRGKYGNANTIPQCRKEEVVSGSCWVVTRAADLQRDDSGVGAANKMCIIKFGSETPRNSDS